MLKQYLSRNGSSRWLAQVFIPGIFLGLLPLALGVLALCKGTAVWDDAYMFARYAKHLIAGRGLAWNVGSGASYGLSSHLFLIYSLPFFKLFSFESASALWAASVSAGLIFLGLIFLCAIRLCKFLGLSDYWPVLVFVGVVLGAAAPELSAHFTSGMDTTLSLAWVTLGLLFLQTASQRETDLAAVLSATFVALTFFVRPDAILLLLPLLVFSFAAPRRKAVAIAAFALVLALELIAGKLYFGYWLPYPFYVKAGRLYDFAFYEFFRGAALHYFLIFLAATAWLVLAIFAQLFLVRSTFSARQAALIVSCSLFALFQLFFVTPIMGEHCRFFFPMFPLMCCLGIESAARLVQWAGSLDRLGAALKSVRFPFLFLFCIAAAVSLKPGFVVDSAHAIRAATHNDWDLTSLWRERFAATWSALEEVSTLPSDTVIAATEVGLLGAMNPDKTIIDMTGLHQADFLSGFTTEALWKYAPDIIYMPFPHYVAMTKAIENSPLFQEKYLYIPAQALNARLGVALRRDAKYFEQLSTFFGGATRAP